MNLRSHSVADSGWLAQWTVLINKIETEGQRCVAWPLSVIKNAFPQLYSPHKTTYYSAFTSANKVHQCRAYCCDLRRIKMHYYNKRDIVYLDIAVVWMNWVRSQLVKLLPWTKSLFINLSLLCFFPHYENIALSGDDYVDWEQKIRF